VPPVAVAPTAVPPIAVAPTVVPPVAAALVPGEFPAPPLGTLELPPGTVEPFPAVGLSPPPADDVIDPVPEPEFALITDAELLLSQPSAVVIRSMAQQRRCKRSSEIRM